MLTIPASFDEAARALTLEAATRAGLERVRLVEEPQAAFYNWLDRRRDDLEAELAPHRLALVLDCGGGTTDLSLIRLELRESGPRVTRIAVGDHLMLGGDNMDLALARRAEPRIGGGSTLGTARFSQLLQQARAAKEQLLGAEAPESVGLTVLGTGSKLVGGAQSTTLDRSEVEDLVLDGFFPRVDAAARPEKRRGAIVEFGLPYVADAGITRHMAAFLADHDELVREALGDKAPESSAMAVPDAVLLNGGVFLSPALQERVADVMSEWRQAPVRLLENAEPELAVARGAVAYGLARRGVGLRIGGGSARTYFLALDDAGKEGVCLLPRGTEEGEEIELERRSFALQLGRPVRFALVTSAQDVRHIRAGDLVPIEGDEFRKLPDLAAVLETDASTESSVPVHLVSALTEVGTLELGLVSRGPTEGRWKLEFQLRGRSQAALQAERVTQLHPRFAEATDLVRRVYGKSTQGVEPKAVKTLRTRLEKVLGDRSQWDTPLLRELFGSLLSGAKRRRRSADHERVWFNLVGYTLRPGFGYPLDRWRVNELWGLFAAGVQFMPEAQNQAEWWILWRRIAGGLDETQQGALLDAIEWYLHPPTKRPRQRPPGPKWQGYDDMVRLAASLEHVSPARKAKVGDWLLERIVDHEEKPQTWWAVGRLGARVPFHGSAHNVVPRPLAEKWLRACLAEDWSYADQAPFAAMQLARCTGDRARDLGDDLREEVAARLTRHGAPESWRAMVREVTHLDAADEKRVFGESLPPGLRLMD